MDSYEVKVDLKKFAKLLAIKVLSYNVLLLSIMKALALLSLLNFLIFLIFLYKEFKVLELFANLVIFSDSNFSDFESYHKVI